MPPLALRSETSIQTRCLIDWVIPIIIICVSTIVMAAGCMRTRPLLGRSWLVAVFVIGAGGVAASKSSRSLARGLASREGGWSRVVGHKTAPTRKGRERRGKRKRRLLHLEAEDKYANGLNDSKRGFCSLVPSAIACVLCEHVLGSAILRECFGTNMEGTYMSPLSSMYCK